MQLPFPAAESNGQGRLDACWTRVAVRVASALLPLLAVGCSAWNRSSAEPSKLPPVRMSPDAVVIEVQIIDIPVGDTAWQAELWNGIDEQYLSIEVRRRLYEAGFRTGIVGSKIPDILEREMEVQREASLDLQEIGETPSAKYHRLSCRAGKRREVVTGPQISELNFVRNENGSVRGRTLQLASCLLTLRSFPRVDGSIDLEIRPELEHGSLRQKIVAGEGSFRFQAGRDRELLADLTMTARLNPGEMLLVTSVDPPFGLGREFFTIEAADGTRRLRLLTFRLAQSQMSEIIAPDASDRLTTIEE